MRFNSSIISKQPFEVIQLKDQQTGTAVEIYAMGALLNSFKVPVKDGFHNVIDGFDNAEAALQEITYGFKSAKLSPFVCRMANGQFTINGHTYTVGKFYLGNHAIHGLLYDAIFEVVNLHANDYGCTVGLRYQYKGDDKGYPFPFELLINWKLQANQTVSVTTSVVHHGSTPIPYSDGWHPYFTLGTGIDECTLQFSSNKQVEFDDRLLPTGVMIDDNRFENGMLLKDVNLDNCFVLNSEQSAHCVLKNHLLELQITPDKAYPYLQVYIPPHRKSMAIENLSSAPDAFNNDMGLLLLQPDRYYIFSTTYSAKAL